MKNRAGLGLFFISTKKQKLRARDQHPVREAAGESMQVHSASKHAGGPIGIVFSERAHLFSLRTRVLMSSYERAHG